jgi:hypothetical protein
MAISRKLASATTVPPPTINKQLKNTINGPYQSFREHTQRSESAIRDVQRVGVHLYRIGEQPHLLQAPHNTPTIN